MREHHIEKIFNTMIEDIKFLKRATYFKRKQVVFYIIRGIDLQNNFLYNIVVKNTWKRVEENEP